jgi:hypothetical protein
MKSLTKNRCGVTGQLWCRTLIRLSFGNSHGPIKSRKLGGQPRLATAIIIVAEIIQPSDFCFHRSLTALTNRG